MEAIQLASEIRVPSTRSAANQLRRAGKLPGVVYGNKKDPVSIAVDRKEFLAAINGEYGHNAILELDLNGEKTLCMMKDFQFDSVKRTLTHIDLYRVTDDKVVVVPVPVTASGTAKGVKAGGLLKILKRTVKVSAAVKDIPATINHDVTSMMILDTIYIDEMAAPEGCEFVFRNRFPVIRIAKKRGATLEATEEEAADE